jgi:hypothetical protein
VVSVSAIAQNAQVTAKPLTDSDVQLLRQDLQSDKEKIIKDTMQFTDPESAAFWPVYKQYAAEQQAVAQKRLKLMDDYAQSLDNLTDAKAQAMTERLFAIEAETLALRKSYFPRFVKAIGAKRAAKFYQVDHRLSMMINLQLTTMVPLIP